MNTAIPPKLKRNNYIFMSVLLIKTNAESLQEIFQRMSPRTYLHFEVAIKSLEVDLLEPTDPTASWIWTEGGLLGIPCILDHFSYEEIECVVSQLNIRTFSLIKHIMDLAYVVRGLLPKKRKVKRSRKKGEGELKAS